MFSFLVDINNYDGKSEPDYDNDVLYQDDLENDYTIMCSEVENSYEEHDESLRWWTRKDLDELPF
jgi:hypothetical protein